MANLRLGTAFAGLILTILVFMQLLAVVRYNDRVPAGSFDRNFNQWRSRANTATDDGLFLVGAGKADVTGYELKLDLFHYLPQNQPLTLSLVLLSRWISTAMPA
jgi:neutral ceramidase